MKEYTFYSILLIVWFIVAISVFLFLLRFTAPYGRYGRSGWGPLIENKKGWLIMESTAPLVFFAGFAVGNYTNTITAIIFLALWEFHYVYRDFIYPFGLLGTKRHMPIVVISSGMFFNAVNGYINSRYIFTFSGGYSNEWITDNRFIVGVTLFIAGLLINRQADHTLRSLRSRGETEYNIPYGKLYRWVSCPNYLGEIMTWIGWAVATWSWAGLSFALWTIANLVPRARAHHAWYNQQFSHYPQKRKALLPILW